MQEIVFDLEVFPEWWCMVYTNPDDMNEKLVITSDTFNYKKKIMKLIPAKCLIGFNIKNYDLIYPGDVINIPEKNEKVDSFEAEVIRLVNEIRKERGLSPLSYDWQLARVARYKSMDMQSLGYFSHTSPTYGSPFDMMKSFGISYRSAGENIARGYSTPKSVVNGWMNSSGHRANILNSSYTHIGVGYVEEGNYWTQMFISR